MRCGGWKYKRHLRRCQQKLVSGREWVMALLSWICGYLVIVPEVAVRLVPSGSVVLGVPAL